MIKSIVLDLDGTLLNSEEKISETNKLTLKKAREQGVEVFVATGRTYLSCEKYIDELKLETPVITFNGARIVDRTKKVIYELPLDRDITARLIDISQDTNTHLNLYHEDKWYVENKNNSETAKYIEISGLTPTQMPLDEFRGKPTVKALFIGEHEKLLKIEKQVREEFGDNIYTTFSKTFFLEVLHRDVNKGTALKEVMNMYGIALDKVIAFGDGLNDCEMLETAGIGVAMENAMPGLKEKADIYYSFKQ